MADSEAVPALPPGTSRPVEEFVPDPSALVETLQAAAKGKRVLLVDDDPAAVSTIADHLEPLGYRAVGCHSGEQAVERARDLRPDIIVLDDSRSDSGAYDVLRLLKSEPATQTIPVVVLSASTDDSRSRELGAFAQVRKPTPSPNAMAGIRPS